MILCLETQIHHGEGKWQSSNSRHLVECLETYGDAGAGIILSVPCFHCVVGGLFPVGDKWAASPGGNLREGSISQISLGSTRAEGKLIPQAAGQSAQDAAYLKDTIGLGSIAPTL